MEVFSAIDIGSNAARLLVSEVFDLDGKVHYKKRSLVRVPLRLGEEVFAVGRIPEHKIDEILWSMDAYNKLMKVHGSTKFIACATSAMREAANGAQVVARVKAETGMHIRIITGRTEAKILYATHFEKYMDADRSYMYIDVGGGSTEVTIFEKGDVTHTRSFKIGTIRLKNNQITKEHWLDVKNWVEKNTAFSTQIEAIGSGGNINKLYKLSGSRLDKRIGYGQLETLYATIESMSIEQRAVEYGMRSDRADVILPATTIFMKIMNWAKCNEVFVPKFGLADGMLRVIKEDLKVLL